MEIEGNLREEQLRELEELELKELEVLESIRSSRERNLIYHFRRPNPPQKIILDGWRLPEKKVFIISGGNRMGKTTLGSIISISTMLGEFPWSGEKILFPHKMPRKIRYVGQDWEKHIMQVVIPALKKWFPKDRVCYIRKNNVGAEAFWRDEETGSTLEIMSNKQESDLHEGWDGDLVVYDEPPRRDIRVANARGLVDRLGRELFCMTLLKESWIDREVIKAKLPDGRPDPSVLAVHGRIYDNIGYGLTKEGVEQFAKTLSDDEREARLDGKPSYLSGLVYGTFEPRIHQKKRFKIPLNWIVDIAIDVHPRERQAVLFVATAPDGRRYVCDEIWENGDGTYVGEEVIRHIFSNAYRVGRIIIDPASKGDKNNKNTVFDSVANVLMAYDYILEPASKDKAAGILLVKDHLVSPNGDPAIFFFDDLKRSIFEIEGYMWDEDTQKPMDKDDHMMENLYRLMLLNTQYTEPKDEDAVAKKVGKRNPVTGY